MTDGSLCMSDRAETSLCARRAGSFSGELSGDVRQITPHEQTMTVLRQLVTDLPERPDLRPRAIQRHDKAAAVAAVIAVDVHRRVPRISERLVRALYGISRGCVVAADLLRVGNQISHPTVSCAGHSLCELNEQAHDEACSSRPCQCFADVRKLRTGQQKKYCEQHDMRIVGERTCSECAVEGPLAIHRSQLEADPG